MPKGKRDTNDRDDEACAQREVREETGLTCVLDHELTTVHYVDNRGRNKSVRYWAMHQLQDAPARPFLPNDEVDQIAWLTLDDAERRIQYSGDREVLRRFRAWYRAPSS
jgi:8-oxo-dGTP diphosphatase